MSEKRDVIRRLQKGQAIRMIQRETGIHRVIIRQLRQIAFQAGWLPGVDILPDESQINEVLNKARHGIVPSHPLDQYQDDIKRWIEEDTSFIIIHDHLSKRGLEYSESTVRRYIHRRYPSLFRKSVMLRETIPGEILEVDFGYLGLTYDFDEKRNRKTYVFSARLRYSRMAWREVSTNQKQHAFFNGIIHAFEYFGGVCEKIVPDNLKAAVVEASFTDPVINKAFQSMAIHYGFLISPTLPWTPEHKGGVENDVKYIKGNFLPRYREEERQKGHKIPHLDGMQQALESWNLEIAQKRIIKGIGRRPVDIFNDEEKATLHLLPAHRWDIVCWAHAKVQETWRIQYDKSFYSVPYQYIGKTVIVLADSTSVGIYLKDKEIARHVRAINNWTYRREPHHAPPEGEAYLKETKESLFEKAAFIGADVESMCRVIFKRQGIDGMQAVRSLLRLEGTYGKDRLAQACARALHFGNNQYRSVKTILKRGLESEPLEETRCSKLQHDFNYQRPPGYFESSWKQGDLKVASNG